MQTEQARLKHVNGSRVGLSTLKLSHWDRFGQLMHITINHARCITVSDKGVQFYFWKPAIEKIYVRRDPIIELARTLVDHLRLRT